MAGVVALPLVVNCVIWRSAIAGTVAGAGSVGCGRERIIRNVPVPITRTTRAPTVSTPPRCRLMTPATICASEEESVSAAEDVAAAVVMVATAGALDTALVDAD